MKYILVISGIIFIQPIFSNENDLHCFVDNTNDNTFTKTIEKCKEGDILALTFSNKLRLPDYSAFAVNVARACKLDTIKIHTYGGVCEYLGYLRDKRE